MVLVLRRWHALNKGMEFRCFVHNGKLLGVTQRDSSSFYPFLANLEQMLKERVAAFFNEHVKAKFAEEAYAFDVFVDVAPNYRVWLLDFNPWSPTTDTLLFTWDELTELSHAAAATDAWETKWRIVKEKIGVKPDLLSQFKVPVEFAEDPYSKEITEFFEKVGTFK